MFARLTISLSFACFAFPAMASALALLPLRRSGECPEGDDSNEHHCHPDSGFSTTKIIIIIVSCSAFVLLLACALLFYFYKHQRYHSVTAPPPFPAQDGVFTGSSHSEMGYAGQDPHFSRAKKKLYTPTTSTQSTGSSTLGGPPPSPPLPQAMYGFSHGAI